MTETPARELYVMPFHVRYTDHGNNTATGTQRRENPKRSLRDSSWANAPLEQKAADKTQSTQRQSRGERDKEKYSVLEAQSPLDQEEISLKPCILF